MVGGSSPLQGRVEVLYSGTWGTVSHYNWDILDANVVCRQLGYDGAMAALHHAAFGKGKGMIWLDEVKCTGNERSITDCMHKVGAGRQHDQDASVICSPQGTRKGTNTNNPFITPFKITLSRCRRRSIKPGASDLERRARAKSVTRGRS